MDEKELSKYLSTFDSADEKINSYLVDNAVTDEIRWRSRTYLFISSEGNNRDILAYFTILQKSIMIDEQVTLSKSMTKKLNPDEDNIAQCRLIGHLGRSTKTEKGFGAVVLGYAVSLSNELAKREGCRVVRIDCTPGKLEEYYADHGFITASMNNDKDLAQMILLLDKIFDADRSRHSS